MPADTVVQCPIPPSRARTTVLVTVDEAKKIRDKDPGRAVFYCPTCGGQVTIVKGDAIEPHFRHLPR